MRGGWQGRDIRERHRPWSKLGKEGRKEGKTIVPRRARRTREIVGWDAWTAVQGTNGLVQTHATAACEDEIGRAGSREAPYPGVFSVVQLHVAHRGWHRQTVRHEAWCARAFIRISLGG